MTPRRAIELLLRFGLAALFAYAGVTKLLDPRGFAVDIANYRLLPPGVVAPFAAAMPGVEIAAAACLLVPATAHAAAWLVGALMLAFTAAVAQALARGINLECGCFGAARDPVTTATLARDAALLAAAAAAVVLTRRRA